MTNTPIRLTVATRSGSVHVEGRRDTELSIRGGAAFRDADGTVRIEPSSASTSVHVSCPADSDVSVGTASGKIILSGQLGAVRIATASGSVEVEHVASADVRSASADVRIQRCDNECRVVSMSGGIRVRYAGRASIATKSGQIRVTATEGADLRSVNGSVKVWAGDKSDVRARTMSSGVVVLVPRGKRPQSRLSSFSGAISNGVEEGPDGSIEIRTESGSIQVAEQ